MAIQWIKSVDDLTLRDVEEFPVWQFANSDAHGDLSVRPLAQLPAKHLEGRLAGAKVVLANGSPMMALLGNITAGDPLKTRHFLTLALAYDGKWKHLARYHDLDRDEHGPAWLAGVLGLSLHDVFPIAYDVRHLCAGAQGAVVGKVEAEPMDRLTRSELIALAVK